MSRPSSGRSSGTWRSTKEHRSRLSFSRDSTASSWRVGEPPESPLETTTPITARGDSDPYVSICRSKQEPRESRLSRASATGPCRPADRRRPTHPLCVPLSPLHDVADRVLADHQVPRDLPVAPPVSDQAQHPWRESFAPEAVSATVARTLSLHLPRAAPRLAGGERVPRSDDVVDRPDDRLRQPAHHGRGSGSGPSRASNRTRLPRASTRRATRNTHGPVSGGLDTPLDHHPTRSATDQIKLRLVAWNDRVPDQRSTIPVLSATPCKHQPNIQLEN